MSQLQQGRAVAKRVFKRPKSFVKAEKMYDEVFNDRDVVAEQTRKFKPKYSRVTRKIISKN